MTDVPRKLTPETFTDWWAVLCERFDRQPSQMLSALYFDSLSARLTEDEFKRGASRVFESSRFWPTPEEIVREARAGDEDEALAQWAVCFRAMGGVSGKADKPDPVTVRIIAHLGGLGRLKDTTPDALAFVRRDFMALYRDLAERSERSKAPVLSPMTDDTRRLLNQRVGGLLARTVPE